MLLTACLCFSCSSIITRVSDYRTYKGEGKQFFLACTCQSKEWLSPRPCPADSGETVGMSQRSSRGLVYVIGLKAS